LPGWPFLGQISKIWLRFKLVGLKNFTWTFGLTSSWLALKNSFGLLALFWPFFAEIGSYEGKYYDYIFFGNTIGNFFVINAMLDRHPCSDISNV